VSNTRAIEAVTSTLRNLLATGVADLPNQHVTTRPLDKVRAANAITDQLNLFLFQTSYNATWRNVDIPRRSGAGDSANPPLAINLHYLVTALGREDDETRSHRWLGGAMMVFHDHPLLQPMSLEEMSKLWTTFQTQYRTSVAYQVEVVLIESRRASRIPLPVLRRGRGPQEGVTAVAGATLPDLDAIRLPERQSSAFLGDALAIVGRNLAGTITVRLTPMNPRLTGVAPFDLPAGPASTDVELQVVLPNDAAAHAAWVAGFYSLSAIVMRDGQEWSSNALPMSIAPRVEGIAPPNPVPRAGNGEVTLTCTCSPDIRLEPDVAGVRFAQQVLLLFGTSRQIPPQKPAAAPGPLPERTNTAVFRFTVAASELGEHLVRLRVDGVDMPVIDRTVTPPDFDARQKVTIV
jgi:hypothetical protein